MRVTVLPVLVLAIAGCAPRLAGTGFSPTSSLASSSECSTSKTMAVAYFAVAAAGVAATGALWPQVEEVGDAARNNCEECHAGMALYAAPAIASIVGVGLGSRHLERAERCQESRLAQATPRSRPAQ